MNIVSNSFIEIRKPTQFFFNVKLKVSILQMHLIHWRSQLHFFMSFCQVVKEHALKRTQPRGLPPPICCACVHVNPVCLNAAIESGCSFCNLAWCVVHIWNAHCKVNRD